MTVLSRALARFAGLRSPETPEVLVEPDVRLRAPDGVELLTDLHLPADGAARPTVLVRTPYGRSSILAALALPFAERGYNLVIQSTRGTFGSGGAIHFPSEAGDGRSVADWIVEQRWSDGTIATFGPSYLSFTQWALASTRPPQLRAMAIQIMASNRRESYYPGGSFALDTALQWVQGIALQKEPHGRLAYFREGRARGQAARMVLPLRDADLALTGRRVPYYQDWLEHPEPGDPYWEPVRYTRVIPELELPVSFVAGWYDYFLPYELNDWEALSRSGAPVQLVVGPWTHTSGRGMLAELREALDWFDLHLRGRPRPRPAPPVRLALQPRQGWIESDEWPSATPRRWHLWPDGALNEHAPPPGPPSRYRYDPADPTPAVGGSMLSPSAGRRDNSRLEARDDVLTFTGRALREPLTVVGAVVADLYVECDRPHFDLFARLCDVDRRGRSHNVTDGLVRIRPEGAVLDAEGVQRVVVELFATAYRFLPGHRVRLQVSSGSHPRYARNLGSGEPLATGTTMVVQSVGLHHDPVHPSGVELPVLGGP
jgi:putative CocE/NonD family hydrolase